LKNDFPAIIFPNVEEVKPERSTHDDDGDESDRGRREPAPSRNADRSVNSTGAFDAGLRVQLVRERLGELAGPIGGGDG